MGAFCVFVCVCVCVCVRVFSVCFFVFACAPVGGFLRLCLRSAYVCLSVSLFVSVCFWWCVYVSVSAYASASVRVYLSVSLFGSVCVVGVCVSMVAFASAPMCLSSYIFVCVYLWVWFCVWVYICVCVCVLVCIFDCAYVLVFVGECLHLCLCLRLRMCVVCVFVCVDRKSVV